MGEQVICIKPKHCHNVIMQPDKRKKHTLSNFSKESARRGSHPLIASPATAASHEGHPAATCSPSMALGTLPTPGCWATTYSILSLFLSKLSPCSTLTEPFPCPCLSINAVLPSLLSNLSFTLYASSLLDEVPLDTRESSTALFDKRSFGLSLLSSMAEGLQHMQPIMHTQQLPPPQNQPPISMFTPSIAFPIAYPITLFFSTHNHQTRQEPLSSNVTQI